ncbi:MAG: hypothetical protein LUC97_07260 [Clostridiales bacterium]|nr:hypothetical protein [Clostridiales bacterium]
MKLKSSRFFSASAGGYEMKRKIKDSVFTKMFRQKKYLLQLYQALHPEDKKLQPMT